MLWKFHHRREKFVERFYQYSNSIIIKLLFLLYENMIINDRQTANMAELNFSKIS